MVSMKSVNSYKILLSFCCKFVLFGISNYEESQIGAILYKTMVIRNLFMCGFIVKC